MHQHRSSNHHPNRLRSALLSAVILLLSACATGPSGTRFDPRNCLDTIPSHVDGLRILAGPRTEANIIRDMVPAICNGQVLFRKMQNEDGMLKPGSAVFRVVVEYTGEVKNVSVAETTIASGPFMAKVSAMIENTDFTFWARNETDTVFLYPVRFGR